MSEVFKPRKNMVYGKTYGYWHCHDENGFLVCDGGPSQMWDEGRQWGFFISGIGYHRLDGPAISTGEWYIHGIDVTDEIYAFAEENSIDLENLTDEDKVLITLKFG